MCHHATRLTRSLVQFLPVAGRSVSIDDVRSPELRESSDERCYREVRRSAGVRVVALLMHGAASSPRGASSSLGYGSGEQCRAQRVCGIGKVESERHPHVWHPPAPRRMGGSRVVTGLRITLRERESRGRCRVL